MVAGELNINKEDLQKLQAQSKVDNKVISNDEVDKVSEGQKIFNYAFSLWHYLSNVLYCFKLCISNSYGNC